MNTAQIKDRQIKRAKERKNKSNGLTNERKEGKTKQEQERKKAKRMTERKKVERNKERMKERLGHLV